ncbi:hypothetical protein LEN26_011772 [Aphanomyces euteiches]|nr:hypothetical protein LEN26_011772 [Aphanomyces euteiches]
MKSSTQPRQMRLWRVVPGIRRAPIDALLVRRDDEMSGVSVDLFIVQITPQGAMRFWTFLAAACTAVVAFDQRRNDVQVMHSIASTTDVVQLKNRVLTAPGKANQANNPRGKYERFGFKHGGRTGAAVGAIAGAVGGTLAGGAIGSAAAGPVGSGIGAAAGITGGLYTGWIGGRNVGAKIGAAGGRVVDKQLAKKKGQANAPPPGAGKKIFSRSNAMAPSPNSSPNTAAAKKPGFFTRLTDKFKGKKASPNGGGSAATRPSGGPKLKQD